MSKKKKRIKRTTRRDSSFSPNLLKRAAENDRMANAKIVLFPKGVKKMSDVLEEFIEPFVGEAETDADYRGLLKLAITAWNLALVDPEQREEALSEVAKTVPWTMRRNLKRTLNEMIERKLLHFADNERFILDFEVTDTPEGLHLSVMATMPNPSE